MSGFEITPTPESRNPFRLVRVHPEISHIVRAWCIWQPVAKTLRQIEESDE